MASLYAIQANLTTVSQRGLDVWYSYATPIAFRKNGRIVMRRNDWGPTTGKHMNVIGIPKEDRLDSQTFEDALKIAENK